MDMNELASQYTQKLESLLASDFSAQGHDLEAKARSVEAGLPDELRDFLQEIARLGRQLHQSREPDAEVMDFVFRCGQAFERLEALRQIRAAENLAFIPLDGSPPEEPGKTELDAVARFVAARDRLLKAVANFTLKLLLILAGLLILGMLIGLI
jgi:hypothetical protein